jgi:hypothetical protein
MTRDNLMELVTSFLRPDVEIEIDIEAAAATTNGRTEIGARWNGDLFAGARV